MLDFQAQAVLSIGTVGNSPRDMLARHGDFQITPICDKTPYGPVNVLAVDGDGYQFFMIDRHHFTGRPCYPHMIRMGGAAYLFRRMRRVPVWVGTSAVGVFPDSGLKVGDIAVPTSYMDLRGEAIDICPSGQELPARYPLMTGHQSPEGLICRELLAAVDPAVVHRVKGWLACTTGPLYETIPERLMYHQLGATFMGMHTIVRIWKWIALLNMHFLPLLHVTNIIDLPGLAPVGDDEVIGEDDGAAVEAAGRDVNDELLRQFFLILDRLKHPLNCKCIVRREADIFADVFPEQKAVATNALTDGGQ